MAAYADWVYYINTYKGVLIPADSFDRYAQRATDEVDYHTLEQASAIITADTDTATVGKIQMATCAVAEALFSMDQQSSGTAGVAASERVGDYSVNYAVTSDVTLPSGAKINNAMRKYLAFTGLLFRGFE